MVTRLIYAMTRKARFKRNAFEAIHSAARGLPTCIFALSEHQRVDGTEVGGWHQAAQRHGA